ncbi:hypothetical protein BDB00DRAFT_821114 [Zychaea mexicana]|uniref:uncharacterized protein n=1 Tax=Zychaea mexicana TaxID=64656 RepID=UPI0022FF29EC|nr:uncharacterized protein BDB00DRAFT_821114 [Zychaea mexicana]KAI9493880.1 hypothetical protein BDB00DRAFT_821114 [Zychaea mexicana]
MTWDNKYDAADIAELESLKALASRPGVIGAIEKILEDCQDHTTQTRRLSNASSSSLREPISRTKATTQTIYITSGYGWDQSDQSVIIYLPIKDAKKITTEHYNLQVQPRAIQLDINEHEGVNYNFRISQLHGYVAPEQTKAKVKETRFVIYLRKAEVGKHWADLRLKTTRDVYDELKRAEDRGTINSSSNTSAAGICTTTDTTTTTTSPSMDAVAREIYQNADNDTKRTMQESWKQSNTNPFDVLSKFEEHRHHHHHHQ